MANILSAQPAPQTAAQYEAEFEMLMQEANGINERMRQERVEIERLKTEEKMLVKEIGRLKGETRAMLVSMGAKI